MALSTAMTSEHASRVELLQGTLDLIVLRALATMGPQHAYDLAARLEQMADHPFTLNQGTLYVALVRLDQKGWIKGAWVVPRTIGRRRPTPSPDRAGGRSRCKSSGGADWPVWWTSCSSKGPSRWQRSGDFFCASSMPSGRRDRSGSSIEKCARTSCSSKVTSSRAARPGSGAGGAVLGGIDQLKAQHRDARAFRWVPDTLAGHARCPPPHPAPSPAGRGRDPDDRAGGRGGHRRVQRVRGRGSSYTAASWRRPPRLGRAHRGGQPDAFRFCAPGHRRCRRRW